MHHAGVTVPCPNRDTVTFRRDSHVEIQSQAVYRPLFDELWGGFPDTVYVAFRLRVAAIRYPKIGGRRDAPRSQEIRTLPSVRP